MSIWEEGTLFKQRKFKHFSSVVTTVSILFEDIYNAAPPSCRAHFDSMTGEELAKYIAQNQRHWAEIISNEIRQHTMPTFKESVSKALSKCANYHPQNLTEQPIH